VRIESSYPKVPMQVIQEGSHLRSEYMDFMAKRPKSSVQLEEALGDKSPVFIVR